MKLNVKIILLSLLFALTACSQESGISIADPKIRETLPGQSLSAGYMVVVNNSAENCPLERATAPEALVEIHQHLHNNGRMQMRQVHDFVVRAGKQVKFEPGGYHLMLTKLGHPLKAGAELPLTFYFGECGVVEIIFPVVPLADS